MKYRVGIHWFRRDLRIADNPALTAAVAQCDVVWTVFCFDPKILQAPDVGAPRVAYLLGCLASLEKNVAAAGGILLIRRGDPEQELVRLGQETGATKFFWNRDYEPYARTRDAAVEKALIASGWEVETTKDGVIHEAHEVLKADGKPYFVFTPYSKVWRALPKSSPLAAVKFKSPTLKPPNSDDLPTLSALGFKLEIELPPIGERAARERMKQFMAGPVLAYQSKRNYPGVDGTSKLSPDLRFGTISARTVWAAAEQAKVEHPASAREADTFVSELIWREFYRQILWHYPHVEKSCFKPEYDALAWENNERYFHAWCEGKTGYPLVDAAMRQLNATGWMHNRLRMVAAMFLTKDLLINWQWGERYFMQKLLDGDLASNNGGWQWSASTGTDAAPYFRIFSPASQAEKFDPEGKFIEKFVPEVNSLSYPAPIVDHGVQRVKAMQLFKQTR
jgi:deoxyribodipyrimidine photo-lyase